MTADPRAMLDLDALLATATFDEEDLAHNRRGVLSPRQEAWRAENPRFVEGDAGTRGTVESVVGRVSVEGRHAPGRMGETRFAQLAIQGRRLSLRPGIEPQLVESAPYRAYAAYGWIWSIEPIDESELHGAGGAGPYRAAPRPTSTEDVANALLESLATELDFDPADVVANRDGRFSDAQRATARKMLLSTSLRLTLATVMAFGFVWVLVDSPVSFPVLAVAGIAMLGVSWVTSARAFRNAVARFTSTKPLSVVARLDTDPTNRDRLVFEAPEHSIKIPRAAVAISEAPLSEVRMWRFELYLTPRTFSIVAVRPLPPRDDL